MNDWSTDDRAQRIWQTLCGMYGARLIRDFGEEVPEVWKAAIKRLTDVQLRRGLAALGNSATGRTPTLPEFVHACKTISPTEAAAMAPRLAAPDYDQFHCEGQLGLLTFIRQRGGVPPRALAALIQAKNSVVENCRILDADGDPEGLRLPFHLRKRLADVMAEYERGQAA